MKRTIFLSVALAFILGLLGFSVAQWGGSGSAQLAELAKGNLYDTLVPDAEAGKTMTIMEMKIMTIMEMKTMVK